MVKINQLNGRVAIIPLLQRRLEIDRLEVIGATILIEEDKKGASNWRFGSPASQKSQETSEEGKSFEFGGLDEVLFENTILVFRRPAMTETLELDIHGLKIEAVGLPRRNHFKLNATYRGQEFTASGKAGLIADIIRSGSDWPLYIDISTKGTNVNINGALDWSTSPPTVQGTVAITIEDSAGIEKLTGIAMGLPLPMSLAATVKSADGQYLIEPIESRVGESEITGSLGIKIGGEKPIIKANLQAASIQLSKSKTVDGRTPESGERLFSDAPFPLDFLKTIDGDVDVKVDRLILTNKLPLEALQISASLQAGRLKVHPLTALVGGGKIDADLDLAAVDDKPAALSVKFNGKGISGEKLAAAMGYAGTIVGGDTDVAIHLDGPGTSLAHFMGGANGEMRLVMGPGVFKGAALNWGGDALTQLADLVNPYRRREKKTNLNCGVIRLPTVKGIITVDHSIAVETDRLNIVAAGQINLRNETVAMGFRTRAKEGIGIGAVDLAELVKVSGKLSKPSIGVDTIASAKKALSLGGALATAGLSLIGEAFLKKTTADPHPCRTALTGARQKSSVTKGLNRLQKKTGDVVNSIKDLFKK